MADSAPPPKADKTVDQLVTEFNALNEQARAIQDQMGELTRQIAEEAEKRKPPGTETIRF